jgi:hypothetical protein
MDFDPVFSCLNEILSIRHFFLITYNGMLEKFSNTRKTAECCTILATDIETL